MIDEEQMKRDFIERRKRYNERLSIKKTPLNVDPMFLVITYKNGAGKMVIDRDDFYKLPKRSQKKILDLMESA